MNKTNKLILKLLLCIVFFTTIVFLSHVLIEGFTKPLITKLSQNMKPSTGNYYPLYMITAAYLTAFIMISIEILIYYYAGHLLKISNKFIKSLVLAFLLLESKGELIRDTLVGYLDVTRLGAHKPFLFIILNQAGLLVPNLILAFLLVYFCPLKNKTEKLNMKLYKPMKIAQTYE